MITDALLQLSDQQAVTVSAGSANSIDLGVARDVGAGEDLYATFGVDVTATAAGAADVTFQVISGTGVDGNGVINAGQVVLGQTGAIPITDLVAGRAPISLCVPQSALTSLPTGQRYLGVYYSVGTGPLTAGKFSCYIGDSEIGSNKFYPSGFSVA